MRTFFVSCIVTSLIGCAATKPTTETRSATAASATLSNGGSKIGRCQEGNSADGYGCTAGHMCPSLMNDVREKTGFHIVSFGTDGDGSKFVHVADTCQHYFCGVNEECLGKGDSEASCMQPTGCQLVHKL